MIQNSSFTQDFIQSYGELKKAQKRNNGVSLYSAYVNRPFGRVFAATFHQTSMTPNQVTGIGALLTFGSLFWLAFFATDNGITVLVGVLLLLGFAIDSADGQLARLQGTSSLLGEWLDHILDNARIGVMHLAVLAFLSRTSQINFEVLLVVCGVFLVSSASIFFGGILSDQFAKRSALLLPAEQVSPAPNLLRSMVLLPVDYGITCLSFLLLSYPRLFFAVYAILAICHLLVLPILALKWARGLKVSQ